MSQFRSTSAAIAALAGAIALILATFPAPSNATTTCHLVAAPNGSDSAPGSAAAPLATVQALLDNLAAGQTGCLRAGKYVQDEFKVRTAGVRLISYPGERATLQGRVRIDHTADGAVVENLTLDGRNPSRQLGPLIYADSVVLRGNEITNGNTAICVHIDDYPGQPAPRGVLIEGNEIHHCGELPATNHHHGIYVANATGTVIRSNVIYANADRGVQLYPNADDSVVTKNVIDGNGQGVIFGGGEDSSSDGNVVSQNVISNATIRYNVESHWQGPTGRGNVARDNCVWTTRNSYEGTPSGSGIADLSGATHQGNVIANPGYANPAGGNYALNPSSPCASVIGGVPPVTAPGSPKPGKPAKANKSSAQGMKTVCAPFDRNAPGRRYLVATSKNDRLVGGSGKDRLVGLGGNDRLRSGTGGPDCLMAGAGRDRIVAENGRADFVICGPGRDRVVTDPKDRVRGCERIITRR